MAFWTFDDVFLPQILSMYVFPDRYRAVTRRGGLALSCPPYPPTYAPHEPRRIVGPVTPSANPSHGCWQEKGWKPAADPAIETTLLELSRFFRQARLSDTRRHSDHVARRSAT